MNTIESLISALTEIGEDITPTQLRKIRAALKMTRETEDTITGMLNESGIGKKNPAYRLVFDLLSDDESFIDDFLNLSKLDFMEYMKDSLHNPKDIHKDLLQYLNGNKELVEALISSSYLEGMIVRGKGEIALSLLCKDAKMLPLLGSDGDIMIGDNTIEVKYSSSPNSSCAGRMSNESGGTGNNGLLKKTDSVLMDLRQLIANLPQEVFSSTPELPDTGMKVCYTRGPSKRVDKWIIEHLKPEYVNEGSREMIVEFFIAMWQNFFMTDMPIIREIIDRFIEKRSFQDMLNDNMSVIPTNRSEEFGKYLMAVYLTNYLKKGSLLSITKQNDDTSRAIYVDSSLIEGKSVYEVYEVLKDTKLTFAFPSIRKSAGKCGYGGVFVSK